MPPTHDLKSDGEAFCRKDSTGEMSRESMSRLSSTAGVKHDSFRFIDHPRKDSAFRMQHFRAAIKTAVLIDDREGKIVWDPLSLKLMPAGL